MKAIPKFLGVVYCTAGRTTKNSLIYKNINYIFILRWRRFCVVVIQSERIRTYLSSVAGTLIVKLCNGWRTHMRSRQVCLSDQRVSAFSPKLQTLYSLSSPKRKYEYPLCLAYFLFMACNRNLHTFVFFPVICWSSLRTEISVTLSIGDKLYSSPSSFPVTHFVDVILRPGWTC